MFWRLKLLSKFEDVVPANPLPKINVMESKSTLSIERKVNNISLGYLHHQGSSNPLLKVKTPSLLKDGLLSKLEDVVQADPLPKINVMESKGSLPKIEDVVSADPLPKIKVGVPCRDLDDDTWKRNVVEKSVQSMVKLWNIEDTSLLENLQLAQEIAKLVLDEQKDVNG